MFQQMFPIYCTQNTGSAIRASCGKSDAGANAQRPRCGQCLKSMYHLRPLLPRSQDIILRLHVYM